MVVAFDNISMFILLRQSAFDSVRHFRKSVRNSFVKVWQIEKFHFETELEEKFFSHLANAENRKKVLKAVFKPVLSGINAFTENLTYLARQGGGFVTRLTAGMKI